MTVIAQPISFVSVSHDHLEYIEELIASIVEYWCSPFEFIVVDNLNSGKFEILAERYNTQLDHAGRDSLIRVLPNKVPTSFGVGNNVAIQQAKYEQLFIINPDTRFLDTSVHDWYAKQASLDQVQLCYPRLLNSDGSVQQHYNEWPNIANQAFRLVRAKLGMPTAQLQRRKDWFFASAIITSKSTFSQLNGFEELFPLYCEDVDLCYKARLLDIPCKLINNVQMIHHLGGEAKHKHLTKALISNILWRYVKVRNYIYIKLLNKRYG